MKSSDFIIDFFVKHNIHRCFGYIGGMVTHLIDSIDKNIQIEMINCVHEQGAGFAAEGYTRTTNNNSVVIVTSGPGATNLITPIASCFFDSTPVLFITGQVNTFEYKKYPNIRQNGFQETNIVDIVKPITKYATQIMKIDDLQYELEKALFIANDGVKGPVLIDIPMDMQRQDLEANSLRHYKPRKKRKKKVEFSKIVELLNKAIRPIVIVGNGVHLSQAKDLLKKFLKQSCFPVVESLMGVDSVCSKYTYNLGMLGIYGNRGANIAISIADTILVLGSRLDVRQIGVKRDIFENKKIIQVDIDENQLGLDNIKNKIPVCSRIDLFLKDILKYDICCQNVSWLEKIIRLKKEFFQTKNLDGSVNLPNKILTDLFFNLKNNDVVCADVGQNQMWVAQSANVLENNRYLFSGGLGSMGFALPAGIGASFSGNRVIIISGDGGFQMNIQELEIIKRRNLPVKIIVMNNRSLAMVRQFQDMYFEGRNPSTVSDYSCPNFEKVADAYGIKNIRISAERIVLSDIQSFLSSDEPFLLNLVFNEKTEIQPKVLFGNSIDNMHPLLSKEKLEECKTI